MTGQARSGGGTRSSRRPRLITETIFFPAAALYGGLALPVSVHGMLGGQWAPPGLVSPTGHAHEMFFGYALAVVTGFLVNRLGAIGLTLLLGLWLAARIAFLFAPGSAAALGTNIAFALAVALTAAPRFMKAAKKSRNRVIGPLVIALCTAGVAFQLVAPAGGSPARYAVLATAVVLFAMLMLFFGGRLIAPAAAGAIEKTGGMLTARVQPRIEGAILLAMAAATALTLLPGLRPGAGAMLVIAGILALVRLARWRLWRARGRMDLYCLGVGYAWLGTGLVLLGAARGFDFGLSPAAATHAITVGALGTLTTNVMARTRLLRLRIDPASKASWLAFVTAAMSTAAVARVLAPHDVGSLAVAATAWLLATFTLLGLLMRYR
ncbi:MAG: NnrS family protein [Wenzhouxiangella sp.]